MKIILQLKKLERLANRLEKNAYKKAIRAGTALIRSDLKASAPMRSGALRQSISTKVDSARGSTVAYGVVGPRSKFVKAYNGQNVQPGRYSAPLEIGPHKRPFLQPAWQANKDKYLEAVRQVLKAEIYLELR
jgi:HK97 gp10 family phage protein